MYCEISVSALLQAPTFVRAQLLPNPERGRRAGPAVGISAAFPLPTPTVLVVRIGRARAWKESVVVEEENDNNKWKEDSAEKINELGGPKKLIICAMNKMMEINGN
jgi:hypothetical protein